MGFAPVASPRGNSPENEQTFITLCREDGAAPDVLRLVTHAPSTDILDLYTSVPWERLCGEVAKLRIERRKGAEILTLHSASCYSGLLQGEEEAREVAGLESGGAGNRIETVSVINRP